MQGSAQVIRRSILAIAIAMNAMAQSDRGAITGTVQDPAGAVVPGATIVAKNTENGSVFQTITTPTGNFTIASLPVGTYDLTLEAPGFKKVTQEGVRVQVAQILRLDFLLQVGATTESITVTAEAPLLRTENGEQSVNVSGDRINELPLNFGGGGGAGGNIRSWTAFALLSPGVTGNNQNTRVNGSPGGNFKIIVEGQDVTSANDTTWTSTVSQASVEMIEEFSLQTSNYSPNSVRSLAGSSTSPPDRAPTPSTAAPTNISPTRLSTRPDHSPRFVPKAESTTSVSQSAGPSGFPSFTTAGTRPSSSSTTSSSGTAPALPPASRQCPPKPTGTATSALP